MNSRSTFYSDGYRDAEQGHSASRPSNDVFGAEYDQGYADGKTDREAQQAGTQS
ncbi:MULTISPECIES: hypothetical protein [Pseudomonas]|uniref:hypothetical protein n=1 Tax=Pseudomonas TaxID=286 RepID=UPI000A8EC54F|nr:MULTISPECIES: hypothetical protein [Pseudomonas]